MHSRVFGDISKIPRDPVEAALFYHNRGLQIVPFKVTNDGRKIAISKWKYFEEPISVGEIVSKVADTGIFGMVVPKGICILDLDAFPVGFNNLIAFAESQPERNDSYDFIDTLTVITPKGGVHLYYLLPNHRHSFTSTSKLVPKVDVRGAGQSCIILPPSRINGYDTPYSFDSNCSERKLPPWVFSNLREKRPEKNQTKQILQKQSSAWAINFLDKCMHEISTAVDGTRNSVLNAKAYSCYKFIVNANLMDKEYVTERLSEAALSNGLNNNEIKATLDSALRGAS